VKPRLTVGRYEVYEAIARGGMGAVHVGRLLGAVGFGRIVAIKRMHPQLLSEPEVAKMFLDEARLASRIQHPNVVSVLDVVEAGDELLLVMEYVRGESLSALLRAELRERGPAPLRIAAAVVAQALRGLHAAHEARGPEGDLLELVHRDISPQNILVGVDGLARVLDFGVAKSTQRLQSTREGELKGKPAYMAPEQLQGKASRQTDVYAMGVVLWEALAGRRLFAGESDLQIMAQILEATIDAPSVHRPEISPALDAIVRQALASDPAGRFATAREMALAIEQTGETASAAEVGAWVEAVARDALAKRDASAARIEASARPEALPVEADRASAPPRATPAPDVELPRETVPGEPITRIEAVRTRPGARTGARRSPALTALAGALFLAGAGIAMLVFRLSGPAPAAGPSARPAALPVPVVSAAPPPVTPPPALSATASAAPQAPAAPSASGHRSAPWSSASAPPAKTPAPKAPAKAASPDFL
jgi:eukaryotic-like serine/threonine-protein kinase